VHVACTDAVGVVSCWQSVTETLCDQCVAYRLTWRVSALNRSVLHHSCPAAVVTVLFIITPHHHHHHHYSLVTVGRVCVDLFFLFAALNLSVSVSYFSRRLHWLYSGR